MLQRSLLLACLFTFALVALPVFAASQPLLAVLELDAKGGISSNEASTLTDRLRAHLIHAERYRVLERDKMQLILKEQGFQQSLAACQEQDCSVRLGRLLGVNYLLSGSVSRVDGLYVLNARLLDVEKGLILREEYTDCECPLKDLLTQGTRQLAERLLQLPNSSQSASVTASSVSAGPLTGRIKTQTLAGSGWAGAQDGPAADARFSFPVGLALLPDGSWLIADTGNHRLRRLSADKVSTFAGANWDWFKGELLDGFADGPALQARFHHPMALLVDTRGVVYVADTDHHRIRKILPDGQVLSFVGTGAPGYSDGNAAVARFRRPQGLALDSEGNLYVADTDNHVIRKVSPLGIVSTVAGRSQGFQDGPAADARFSFPVGLALAPDGALLIADTHNHRIRRLGADAKVSTLAGSEAGFRDGPAAQARLQEPRALAVSPSGQVYIADTGNHRIRLLQNGVLQTLAGTGARGHADGNQAVGQFNAPLGLVLQGQDLWIADSGNQRLRRIDAVE